MQARVAIVNKDRSITKAIKLTSFPLPSSRKCQSKNPTDAKPVRTWQWWGRTGDAHTIAPLGTDHDCGHDCLVNQLNGNFLL